LCSALVAYSMSKHTRMSLRLVDFSSYTHSSHRFYGSGRQDAAKRQSSNAATRWPIIVLFSNGSILEPLESKMVIGHRVAASPLCRFAASCLPEPLLGWNQMIWKRAAERRVRHWDSQSRLFRIFCISSVRNWNGCETAAEWRVRYYASSTIES